MNVVTTYIMSTILLRVYRRVVLDIFSECEISQVVDDCSFACASRMVGAVT